MNGAVIFQMVRRGPKPRPGKREPNGRLSQRPEDVAARNIEGLDKEERETIATGISARERLWKLDPKVSRDQMAGSFVGRLRLQGDLSQIQYEAAITWQDDVRAYGIARNSPPDASAIDLNRVQGLGSGTEKPAQARRAVRRYEDAREAVQAAQNAMHGRAALFAALSYIVERDVWLSHLVGDLRLALNALAQHYRIGNGRKAA